MPRIQVALLIGIFALSLLLAGAFMSTVQRCLYNEPVSSRPLAPPLVRSDGVRAEER
jgi:hypothetical protein